MVREIEGDMFSAPVDALINPVNCLGATGSGLANVFARRWPEILPPYRRACRTRALRPGGLLAVRIQYYSQPRWVVCFATKDDWHNPSEFEWIRNGLAKLPQELRRLGIRSVAIPALGCGLGELDYADVREVVRATMEPEQDLETWLFKPRQETRRRPRG